MKPRLRLVLIGTLLAAILLLLVGPRLVLRRSTVERFLASYFAGQVRIDSFEPSLWPVARATATGVVLQRQERAGVPPLVTIRRVEIRASVVGMLRSPRHLHSARVEGLVIRVPPRLAETREADAPNAGGSERTPLVVDQVVAEEARIEILPDEPGKRPVAFELHHLDARSIATDRPLTFETELVNPKPRGLIRASGTFGPWNARDAGVTRVSGKFTYRDVNLATIRGIGGHLSADGTFDGPLRRIAVMGTTHTPDFMVDVARQPVPLDTRFQAYVDGTNGNTYLQRVDARLAGTPIVTSGAILDEPDPASRAVVLDVTIDNGRIEDVLRLGLQSAPPLSGEFDMKTRFRLPGDERHVIDKLELEGQFTIGQALFASPGVQAKIGEMSARAQGHPEGRPDTRVATDFDGRFRLQNGTLTFRSLQFKIPGATVDLHGTFAPRTEVLDMHGTLRIDAKVSETTSGWKSVLLKVIDPVFAKGKHGSVVPIKLTGTARKPEFGIDAGKVVK